MLEEAVEVIRLLWQGGVRSYRGTHYRVGNARIYTLPESPWPNAGIPGQLSQELAQPAFFEQAATLVGEEEAVGSMPVGPDPERHLAAISEYLDAGYDHVYIHQVGKDQDGFFRFYEREVLPKLG